MSTTRAHAAALRRFKRAMRRHENRAKALRVPQLVVERIREGRLTTIEPLPYTWLAEDFRDAAWGHPRQPYRAVAFLYERAAAAVARLRADIAAADAASAARVCSSCGHDPQATEKHTHFVGTPRPMTISVGGHGIDCPNDPYQAKYAALDRQHGRTA